MKKTSTFTTEQFKLDSLLETHSTHDALGKAHLGLLTTTEAIAFQAALTMTEKCRKQHKGFPQATISS
eukprot:4639409-Amphidinium_carterae.1